MGGGGHAALALVNPGIGGVERDTGRGEGGMEDDSGTVVTLLGHECGTKQLEPGLGRSIGSGALQYRPVRPRGARGIVPLAQARCAPAAQREL